MTDGFLWPVAIAAAIGWGIGLGLLYFGGLWLTVRRLSTTRHPVRLSLVSLGLRLGLCLGGFALLLRQPNPLPLVSCLGAFFWTRNRMVQRWGVSRGSRVELRS